MSNLQSTKILITDDHPLFRRGLAELIKEQVEFEVVAEASNGNEALKYLKSMRIDIVLLDINMPDYDGFELLTIIKHNSIKSKAIILTMYDEQVYAQRAFDLGADGYLLKDDAEELIIECLQKINANQRFCSLGEIDDLLPDQKNNELSSAEKRILSLVGTGKSSIEIADMLSVSIRTVDNHRANIANKLGLKGANALLKYAMQNRNLSLKSF